MSETTKVVENAFTDIIPEGKNALFVLDHSGDTRTIWSPDRPDEVEMAKETFEKLTKKGYSAFHVKENGEAGLRMTAFDPKAGKIILVPPIKGG